MDLTGEWLVGRKGTDKLKELAHRLFSKIKADVETEVKKPFDHYVPWMCASPYRHDLEVTFSKAPLPEILVDQATLTLLSETFKGEPGHPLGKLGLIEPDPNAAIYTIYKGDNGDSEADRETVDTLLEGKHLYLDASPLFRERFAYLVSTIVPLESTEHIATSRAAFSSHLLKGAIFQSIPDKRNKFWKIDLAVDIAHELGHQALMVYQSADRIIASDFSQLVHSAVRKVERPSIMSFHAVAALLYMVEFLRALTKEGKDSLTLEEFPYALAELKRYEADLKTGLAALESVQFTDVGKFLHGEILNFSKAQ